MKRCFNLIISYDGSKFHGYQKQPNNPNVQGSIEKVLSNLFNLDVSVAAAGRTDRGVHAIGQSLSFSVDTDIDVKNIIRYLNQNINRYIIVNSIKEKPLDFNARLSASFRTYVYKIKGVKEATPFNRDYFTFIKNYDEVTFNKISFELSKIIGEHDFSYFSVKIPESKPTKKIVKVSRIYKTEDYWEIELKANSFLRGMVRMIIGTIFSVIDGKLEPDFIDKIMQNKYRSSLKFLAPPNGLYLHNVDYLRY